MMSKSLPNKAYLGEGISIEWDGLNFSLYIFDGKEKQHEIILSIDTWLALTRFVKSLENE